MRMRRKGYAGNLVVWAALGMACSQRSQSQQAGATAAPQAVAAAKAAAGEAEEQAEPPSKPSGVEPKSFPLTLPGQLDRIDYEFASDTFNLDNKHSQVDAFWAKVSSAKLAKMREIAGSTRDPRHVLDLAVKAFGEAEDHG